jgi:hypothetical protein
LDHLLFNHSSIYRTKETSLTEKLTAIRAANAITQALQNSITNMNLYLLSDYKYQGITLDQVFAGGAFVDDRNIPVLNADTSMATVSPYTARGFFHRPS